MRTGGILGTLAAVIGLRVLGVSLLFAGFADHGRALGGTTFQAALAFGAYPLALAALMLPLASLSDRWGRRRVMVGALLVSAVGGVLSALADDIVLLALARFLQGMGAVNGIALALVGEVGPPETRTRRMAVLGAAAGGGFVLGILLGAYLTPLVGVPGLLLGHSLATLAFLPLVARAVPPGVPAAPALGSRVLDPRVLALGAAAFAVNAALTGLLFLSPDLLARAAPGLSYPLALTAMALPGGLGMFLTSRLADRGHARAVGVASAALLGAAPLAFLLPSGAVLLVLAGIVFFIGHSSLSSLLPSLTAASSAEGRRGFAQGVQSTMQYLGSFAGAALVGALFPGVAALAALFLACGIAVAIAVMLASR